MKVCSNCNSTNIIKKGKDTSGQKQRYKCNDCLTNYYIPFNPSLEDERGTDDITPPVDIVKDHKNRKWVITTAINDSSTNDAFLETLLAYCDYNKAELLIVPIKYKNNCDEYTWDEELDDFYIDENINLTRDLTLFAGVPISPTAANPLTSFEILSRGKSAIIPHPQLMMKCVAVDHINKGAILYTTGCISNMTYTATKAGERANISHSMSALIVEEDDDIDDFHIRVLNCDQHGGFYDLEKYYSRDFIWNLKNVPAIVIGDEHVAHLDLAVVDATFKSYDSLINSLNPVHIVRHDVLDFYASNHHHKNDFFLQYKKFLDGTHIVEDELVDTIEYLIGTTPKSSTSIIVSSNHNDHLTRWLQEGNPKLEPWNAKLYHKLMYLKLASIEKEEHLTPFELWYNNEFDFDSIRFIKESESFKIMDIELALHGHYGTNGSRGSALQYSKLGIKTIIGHSHTPMIIGDCFQVGHSCKSKMGYNQGPSSWHNAHCIIHQDGSRQMVFIKGGKWKL